MTSPEKESDWSLLLTCLAFLVLVFELGFLFGRYGRH